MSGLVPSRSIVSAAALLLLAFSAHGAISQTGAQPSPASGGTAATLVGLVMPSDARPGETVSATIVTNPNSFPNVPGLAKSQGTVPLAKDANGSATLDGLVVDTGDGRRQPATGPIVLGSPAAGTPLSITFLRASDGTILGRQSIKLAGGTGTPAAPSVATATPSDYTSSSVTTEEGLNAIHGPVGGDSTKTRVLVDGAPAHIVAESERNVYWEAPQGVAPGQHTVTLEEDGRALAAFPTTFVGLQLEADDLTLVKNQTTNFRVTVLVGGPIPSDEWQAGFDSTLVPAEVAEGGKGRPKPPAEGQPAALMLTIENAAGDAVSMQGENKGTIALLLNKDAFASDAYSYTYTGKLTAKRDGGFQITAEVTPFFKEEAGATPVAQEGETPKGSTTSETPTTPGKATGTATTQEKPTGTTTTQGKPTETTTTQTKPTETATTQEKPKENPHTGGNPEPIDPTDIPVPGKPNIYGHDDIAACPERSKVRSTPCIALVIDFSKNVFYEFDVEKIASYLSSSHMCETTYIAPKVVEVPKPWKIGYGKVAYTVQPDPKDVQAATTQNAAEWVKVNAAIADHRLAVAKGGWEFAIELVRGHGSPKYAHDPYECGYIGPHFWTGNGIYRAAFDQGNYNAARQNVCRWLSVDLSCYSGLTPRVVDELNNFGTSTCDQPSKTHWPRHAGWDGDGGMSAATDDAETTNGNILLERQYIQSAVVGAFDQWAHDWNTDIWADVDREALGKQILSNLNSGTGHYTDGGLIEDKAMGCHHTTAGYATK